MTPSLTIPISVSVSVSANGRKLAFEPPMAIMRALPVEMSSDLLNRVDDALYEAEWALYLDRSSE